MSTLRVNTIQDVAGSGTPSINGLAKAWVNFNGTGTVAILASYNVSSITDNGTGDYTVNFTTAMSDGNYVVAMQGTGPVSGTTWSLIPGLMTNSGGTTPTTKTTSAVRFFLFNPYSANAGNYDAANCGVAIFR